MHRVLRHIRYTSNLLKTDKKYTLLIALIYRDIYVPATKACTVLFCSKI